MKPYITLIAAVARNGAIGIGGKMPWRLPEDLQRFRELTWGKSLLMGRRTFASIGRPLPGRHNIVLTRHSAFSAPGCTVVRSVEEGLRSATSEELMVIGGAMLYAALLPEATKMHLTLIHADYPGDTFFPPWPKSVWREVFREDREGFPPYSFVLLERVQSG